MAKAATETRPADASEAELAAVVSSSSPAPAAEPKPPTVLGIGSCRILTPLYLLERKGRITGVGGKIAWYTHSTADALQKVEIITNARQLAPDEVPFVVHGLHKWHPDAHRADLLDEVDLFVVEIASSKLLELDGLEIQRWCLRDILVEQKVPLGPYMSALDMDPASRDLSFLPDSASPPIRDLAARGLAKRQTKEELLAELAAIEKRLGKPLILVPHINVEGNDGRLIPERVQLAETLQTFCEAAPGRAYFDPAEHVRSYGQAEALKDLGHYHAAFEHVLGDKLLKVIVPLVQAQRAAAAAS